MNAIEKGANSLGDLGGSRTRVYIVKKHRNETTFDFQGLIFMLNLGMENVQNVQYLMLK